VTAPVIDIFAPSLYDGVRQPLPQATTLPSWCFTSQQWYERELETIFHPAWHFAGLAASIPQRGEYLTTTLMGQPILAIRDDAGEIRAFRNSCRHRGTLLLEPSGGTCRAIRCRYHSWTYDLQGQLLRAPGMEHAEDFDPAMHALLPVRCDIIQGLIFVNLTDDQPGLGEYLGDFEEQVAAPHRVSEMVCVHRREYTLASNWKLYIEVDMETLHTKHIHRGSIGEQPVVAPGTRGQWVSVFNEAEHTPALPPGERHLGFPPVRGLQGQAARGTHFSVLFPGFFLVTAPDCMWWIHKLAEGPERTRVNVGYCFPRETTERDDFEEVAARYYHRWNQVVEEDDWITEFQHKGLPGSPPGCYTPHEAVVHRVDNWVLDKVVGPGMGGV
jgi:Rieske 2Fe-2S family protein